MLDCTIDGISLSSLGIKLQSYTIKGFPGRKNSGEDLPGADGSFRTVSPFSVSDGKISCVVTADTVQEVHNIVRNFIVIIADKSASSKLVFTDDPHIFYRVDFCDGFDYTVTDGMDSAFTKFSIGIARLDPFRYNEETDRVQKEIASGETIEFENLGIQTPCKIILELTDSSLALVATSLGHTNSGNRNDVVTAIEIDVNINDKLLYNGGIGRDDIIIIDTDQWTLTKNGTSDLANWDGTMPKLKHGKNLLRMTNLNGSIMKVTIEFNRRWM